MNRVAGALSRPVALVALAAALVVGAGPAAADDKGEVDLRVKMATPATGEQPAGEVKAEGEVEGEPFFRATVLARPGLQAKDFVLHQNDVKPPLSVEANKAVVYRDSDEPMAMVILVQGNFRWMGNESYADPNDPEAGAIYEGAHKGLSPAIDLLVKAGPGGSRAGLLVYAEGTALVKQAMGDAGSLSGTALGSQQDYGEYISKPLLVGLTEAWKILANEVGRRKILVVFGDGQDDKEDVSAELKKVLSDLKAADVESYAVYYTAMPDDGPQGQQNMAKIGYSRSYTATSRDNFATYAGNIVELIGSKYYVDFSGDKVLFDGAEHEFSVAVDNQDSDPKLLTLPSIKKKVVEESSLWWLWLLLAIVLVVIVIVIIIVVRRREPEPPPPPVVDLPPPGPQKTIMLGIGGEQDSMPIVGWVVPLGGSNQYQTFKLLSGSTKLGTGGAAHIVVGDGFMSTEHAEIVSSPGGFVLNDLGSTNGTYVNNRRVTSHELVDNDVFKLGKTDFKFKSIN
jgi:hypothetical protein